MFTAAMIFLKAKFGNVSSALMISLGLLIAVFVLFNSSTILSKFGFETAFTLKGKLVQVQNDLKSVNEANTLLADTIKSLQEAKVRDLKIIAELSSEQNQNTQKVNKVIANKTKIEIANNDIIDKTSIYTLTTVTLPLKEINAISESNINSINIVYAELFSNGNKFSNLDNTEGNVEQLTLVSDLEPSMLDHQQVTTGIIECEVLLS